MEVDYIKLASGILNILFLFLTVRHKKIISALVDVVAKLLQLLNDFKDVIEDNNVDSEEIEKMKQDLDQLADEINDLIGVITK